MRTHRNILLVIIILTQIGVVRNQSHISQEKGKKTLQQERDQKTRRDSSTTVTSQISGVVTDNSGAVLPDVEVTLKQPDGTTRTIRTDAEGHYRFTGVMVGQTYALRFFRPGFKAVERSNITVTLNSSSTLDMQLDLGSSPSPSGSPAQSPVPSPTPSSSPIVSPTPSASPGPPDLEALIEKEVQKLRESKIVFNPPREMQEQKMEKIEARISFEDIGPALAQGLEGSGTPQTETLKVSPIMNVTLTGDPTAFQIEGSGAEQVVAGKPFAQWDWYVTPLKSGDQNLTLTATATIYTPERGEKPAYYKTLEKPILVHVDRWRASKQFFANNWQWLWTVILVPGVGLLWGLRRRKQRKRRSR